MFVSRNVVFTLKASTQQSRLSGAHDMSIGDSGELGLSRKPLALVGPIQEGSFNEVESRIGNRRSPNRVIAVLLCRLIHNIKSRQWLRKRLVTGFEL